MNSCPVCKKVFQQGTDADSDIVTRQGERWASCKENAHWKLTFHVKESHPEISERCPRRDELCAPDWDHPDFWQVDGELRTCSYCGSIHPDDFMSRAEAGEELGPTDKNYKVYVGSRSKFYFPHLSQQQKKTFIELINNKKLNIGYPGYFYNLPYFAYRIGTPTEITS